MDILLALLPLLILFFYYVAFAVLHAAYIKVSADQLQGMRVRWRDAVRFALGLMAIILIIRSIMMEVGLPISTGVLIAFSLVLHISVGGWFFGARALTQDNKPAGWKGGILISALAYAFLVITIFIANVVV